MATLTLNADLGSKYDQATGRVLLTGVQALVRLPMTRRTLDRAAGLKTAGFISGYRGSPLGAYDIQLLAAKARLDALDIVVRPAVNEDLGATAVWGTQQVNLYPGARHEGVFGIWYGKAPGVDRTGDVFKHANFAGVSPFGGVVAVAGDDHGAKSSTIACQSEYAFVDAEIPVFAPASVEEVLTFGVKAFDVSRYAGLWTAMTTVSDIMDSSASITIDPTAYAITPPRAVIVPADGLHIRLPDTPLAQEIRHREFRLPAALAFVHVNGFDKTPIDTKSATFGILAAGKAYATVRQALVDLGVDDAMAARLGIRLYKPGLVWPLEPQGARHFVRGLKEVLVIEERRDLVESQLKQICYDLTERPVIVGKRDEAGRPLVKETGELDAAQVARILHARLPKGRTGGRMEAHIARLDAAAPVAPTLHERSPFFCSGCPHNTSTVVPEGSRAQAGIGCHYMVQTMPRNTSSFTQMGGEGVTWVGQAPFTDEDHVFVNLGDGTYFHSGVLAIRQAVAAGVNVTYKILFNDAVAMTGGQPLDGVLTVPILVQQLLAEQVAKVVVVSSDPAHTRQTGALPAGVALHDRADLDQVQKDLRAHPGVTVLVYDQPCATALRRRRKRGLAPDPGVKVFINPRVCEGCGDCSAQSNCISIEPLETEFGVKRQINQSTCNVDLSCVKGFCPSFVTVRGGRGHPMDEASPARLPDPVVRGLTAEPCNLVLAGIGGQGVTSLAAILAMAAHLDGGAAKSVDMLGLAQKGGGVFVHLRLAASPEAISTARIGLGQADLLIANDMVVAHSSTVAGLLAPDRSQVLLNATLSPTSDFTTHPGQTYDKDGMRAALADHAAGLTALETGRIAEQALGDAIFGMMILVGRAWQKGLIPLSRDAIEKAIILNGVAVAQNKKAFDLGCSQLDEVSPPIANDLESVLVRRVEDLTAYQNKAYARRYETAVRRLAAAERSRWPGSTALALTVAQSLYKLMAYKDEYEVARLYAEPAFRTALAANLGEGGRLSLNLAPPLFAKTDPSTGLPRKQEFGPWMLRLMPALASLKVLRGTIFDPFGGTDERRLERALRDEFFAVVDELIAGVDISSLDRLRAMAALPQTVRGFGHIKAASAAAYQEKLAEMRTQGNPTP
jgi:indolepyruvate ferredoxin oxidoreductase